MTTTTTKTKAKTKATTKTKATKASANRHVIVRTYSAGVHYGVMLDRRGSEIDLGAARRVWRWQGRNTLNEIAVHGVGAGSKISEAVSEITILGVIEVIPCSAAAIASLESASWG